MCSMSNCEMVSLGGQLMRRRYWVSPARARRHTAHGFSRLSQTSFVFLPVLNLPLSRATDAYGASSLTYLKVEAQLQSCALASWSSPGPFYGRRSRQCAVLPHVRHRHLRSRCLTQNTKMISLLLLVFLIQLAIYLINTIGASTIDNLVRGTAWHNGGAFELERANWNILKYSYGSFTFDYHSQSRKMLGKTANSSVMS